VQAWLSGTAWVAPAAPCRARAPPHGNALPGIVDVEQPDAVLGAAFPHACSERRALRIAVVPWRLGAVETVILHREREIGGGTACAPRRCASEGTGVQLVQHVPIDIDEIAAIGAAGHQMRRPDLVEQRLRHGCLRV
jgi:hypothetical protein